MADGRVVVMKPVLTGLGMLCLGLAGMGVFLPLLPTTPFLLVAAACFARSSPRFHARLLDSRLFGPLIRNWEENRAISITTKLTAIAAIAVVGGISVVFVVESPGLRILIGGILAINIIFIASIRSNV